MRTAHVLLLMTVLASPALGAELRGHGGPVRALAFSSDGGSLISGSFDSTIIVWTLATASANAVLRFHDGSVNAVAALPDGRFASAGEDGRVALWRRGAASPDEILEGHTAPVVALTASPDGALLASASWDGTARVWTLATGESRVLTGHQGNVNGVAFLDKDRTATAGYDATLRIWQREGPPHITTLPAPQNSIVRVKDGLAAGGADGKVRLLDGNGTIAGEIQIGETPVIALAASPDGTRLAASGVRGAIAIIRTDTLAIEHALVGPGLPVWSLAFSPSGDELFTGGSDRMIRSWDVKTGELAGPVAGGVPLDPLAAYAGDRGAEVFRACVACHALRPEDGVRAGPSLHGVMGRKIGTLPGYNYSEGFRNLDIVWTKETISKLFEIGPHAFTPGTKMPEQTVNRPEDRKALVDFIERATR
jgi:cytochrome c